ERGPDGKELGAGNNPEAEASMFYVAYFKKGAPATDRPVTFIYNGGPGSSTMWLHMGAFGPRRVVTVDNGTHTPAAPYQVVNNVTTGDSVDFNGVMLLSQILNFALSVDGIDANPGSDTAYITALPTYAATAWNYKLVPNPPADVATFVKQAEHWAMTDYALA